eukprot:m.151464 g.151464  ORF g.151464 m.151464 type:complete len:294 (-) comp52827_c0_seq3:112-993(-)
MSACWACFGTNDTYNQYSYTSVYNTCFGDVEHKTIPGCVRSAVVCAVALVTLIISAYHTILAGSHLAQQRYRFIFFLIASMQMLAYLVYFGYWDHFALAISLEYLKLTLYCFVASIFFAFMVRLLNQDFIVTSILWPTHAVVFVGITGVFIYTMVSSRDLKGVCGSPGWLVLSSAGMSLLVVFLLIAYFIRRRLSRGRIEKQDRHWYSRLWWMFLAAFVASISQFVRNVIIEVVVDCDSRVNNNAAASISVTLVSAFLEVFFPIWIASYAVFGKRRSAQTTVNFDSEHDSLAR